MKSISTSSVAQFFLVCIFLFGIPSCKKKDDDCDDVEQQKREVIIEKFGLTSLMRTAKAGENCENFMSSSIPCFVSYKDKDKVTANQLALKFKSITTLKRSFNQSFVRQPFVFSAIACTPPPPIDFTNQKLTYFEITSNLPFNKDYPMGADLSPLMVDPVTRTKITTDDFELLRENFIAFSDTVEADSLHVLTFTFVLDNKDTLFFDTPPINLVKE